MWWKLVLLVLFALIAQHVIKLVDNLGFMRRYHQHHPGKCRRIPGVEHGSEDFAVTSKGEVFVSTGMAWAFHSPSYVAYAKRKNIQGGILLLHFDKPDQEPIRLTLQSSDSFDPTLFKPHGIDIIEDMVKGEHILFVVCHPMVVQDRVEKFQYLPKTKELKHIKTYIDARFRTLNDVAVVGPDSFYATNMIWNTARIPGLLEMMALVKTGSVLYYTNGQVHTAVSGLQMPNGVTISKDANSIYVSVGNTLHMYRRHGNGSLELVQEVALHSQLDNIQYDSSGKTLYIGSHPILHKFIEADDDPENLVAPAQVISVPLKDGLVDESGVTELFYDHGDLISGSSVAVIRRGMMLVGTVQDKMALCQLPSDFLKKKTKVVIPK